MKKTIITFFIAVMLMATTQTATAQVATLSGFDTTVVSYRDTLKNYTYDNVYLIVTNVTLQRGTSYPFMYTPGGNQQFASNTTWKASTTIVFYNSKADYQSGKQSVTQATTNCEFTDTYPTQSAIMTKIIQVLPK